jgi:hypothetical protein
MVSSVRSPACGKASVLAVLTVLTVLALSACGQSYSSVPRSQVVHGNSESPSGNSANRAAPPAATRSASPEAAQHSAQVAQPHRGAQSSAVATATVPRASSVGSPRPSSYPVNNAPRTGAAPSANLSGRITTYRRANQAFQRQSTAAPWSFSQADNIDRFEVRSGDSWFADIGHGVQRSELAGQRRWEAGKDVWLSYSVDVDPRSSPRSASSWVVLGQFHASPAPSEPSAVPPFGLYLLGGELRAGIRSDASPITGADISSMSVLVSDDLVMRAWHSVRVHIRFSEKGLGPGVVQVWLDGQLKVDLRVAVGYNDRVGPYWKYGIYRATSSDDLVVMYKNMALSSAP